jgi:GntR family transcriptional regulator
MAVERMYVDKKSPIPAYFQLKNIILKKIQSGEYIVGSLIPSERDLGESFGISRMTVRQALNQLVLEGVLNREKGRGTFVSRSKLEQKNIMSFSEAVRRKGLVPSAKVLRFGGEDAPEEVAEALGLKDGEKVYVLRRLRLAGGVPVGIEEDFLPQRYCPGLERLDLTGSLYRLIKEEYDHTINYVDNVIEASRPTREERELLDMGGSSIPVIRVTGVNYTESGIRLFYERSAYRSDEYKCSMRIYVSKNLE